MTEFHGKSDYSVSIFSRGRFLCKMAYVENMRLLVAWLNRSRNYSEWDEINVYARRSGRFIIKYRRGNPMTNYPR